MVRLPVVLRSQIAQRRNPGAPILIIALATLMASAQTPSPQKPSPQSQAVLPSCVNTRPAYGFVPPGHHPTELSKGFFWIGTEKLWTKIREDMTWQWRPHGPGHEKDLTAKIFWGRMGYDYRTEPVPKLRVTGKRLDGSAPPLEKPQGEATNAILVPDVAMLTGVWAPTPGCWEITGDYEGDKLSFVVWVADKKQEVALGH